MLGGALSDALSISVFVRGHLRWRLPQSIDMNLFTEAAWALWSTVFMINRWYAHRERESLKRRLIREAGSRSHDIAISAVEWMEREGWLRGEDGLLKGASLTGADAAEGRDWRARILKMRGLGLCCSSWRKFCRMRNLNGASLFMADVRDSLLKDADLRGANLYKAKRAPGGVAGSQSWKASKASMLDMSSTDLLGAVLKDADLKVGTDLQGIASLWEADFTGANLTQCKVRRMLQRRNWLFWERATLSRVDLRATRP